MIKSKIASLAGYVLLVTLGLVILFHILVITGIVPFSIVWGGRLDSPSEMIRFEAVSIFLNLLMLGVVAIRTGLLRVPVSSSLIRVLLWLMCALFALNIIGNLQSVNAFEKKVFTPLTILLAVCCLVMTLYKQQTPAIRDSKLVATEERHQ